MRKRNYSKNNNTVPGFLIKTYKILENPEFSEIISWNEDGKAFKVKKPNEFAEKVLPLYFKTNNFASFVRQLNMYDFHKLRHDSEENEWKHRLFRRGYPNLLSEIKRKINEQQTQETVETTKEQKKITNDTQYLLKETISIKENQERLEKACSVLIAQNTQILGENKLLWGEINKKKDKSQKKIEKMLRPKQIPELAFLSGKTAHEYLKQEDMSDNENDDNNNILTGGGNRNNLGNSKKLDGNDIGNSIKSFQFNNNNNNGINLNNSFNGGLNASNLLSSQSGNQLSMVQNDSGEQFAQKFIDKIMKNIKNKNETKNNNSTSDQSKGSKFNNFLDGYHKQNQNLLQNLTSFMNSHGGTQDLSSLELNNQINQATMNPNVSTDLQKRPLKKMISNPFNPNMSIGMGNEELGNINESQFLGKSKKFKKDDDGFQSGRFGSVNPSAFSNNFNFEEFLQNQQLGGSNIFNGFGDQNGATSINNKGSLDFTKIIPHDIFNQLALPNSTTNQPNSPNRKKPRNINNTNFNNGNNENQSIMNKSISQLGINDSLQGFNPNGNPNASTLFNNPHQQSSQWEDFNKFIVEQKIEDSLNNTHSNTNNNNSHMIDGQ